MTHLTLFIVKIVIPSDGPAFGRGLDHKGRVVVFSGERDPMFLIQARVDLSRSLGEPPPVVDIPLWMIVDDGKTKTERLEEST